jgi:hypothetical protein
MSIADEIRASLLDDLINKVITREEFDEYDRKQVANAITDAKSKKASKYVLTTMANILYTYPSVCGEGFMVPDAIAEINLSEFVEHVRDFLEAYSEYLVSNEN